MGYAITDQTTHTRIVYSEAGIDDVFLALPKNGTSYDVAGGKLVIYALGRLPLEINREDVVIPASDGDVNLGELLEFMMVAPPSIVSGILTASNGLTATGSNIALGGLTALSGDTIIDLDTFALGVGVFAVNSTGAVIGAGLPLSPASIFDVNSTTKGSRPAPKMTEAERLAIAMTAADYGTIVFQTNTATTPSGYYYYSTGGVWERLIGYQENMTDLTRQVPIDASAEPNYPIGLVGDVHRISVAGRVGGASGKIVNAGDSILCDVTSAAGDEATVGANWLVLAAPGTASNGMKKIARDYRLGSALTENTDIPCGAFYFACGVTKVTDSTILVGGGSLEATAIMQINSTTKGFIICRMTTAQRDAIATPVDGLKIFNTTTHTPDWYDSGAGVWRKTASQAYIDARVFGNNAQYVESNGNTNTASVSFIDKVSLTTPSLPAGMYWLDFGCDLKHSSVLIGSAEMQLLQSPATVLYGATLTPNVAANPSNFGRRRELFLSGVNTFIIQFRANGGLGVVASMLNAWISVQMKSL